MEPKYLPKLKKWTDKYGSKENRVPEAQISAMEAKLGKKFPLAYREYLLLTGHYFRAMPISNGFSYLLEHNMQSLAKKNLKEYGISLKSDEFWVFAENEGAEVIFFFYFDEGDDPPVYVCEMQMKDEPDYEYLRKDTPFSEFINFYVDIYNPIYDEPNMPWIYKIFTFWKRNR